MYCDVQMLAMSEILCDFGPIGITRECDEIRRMSQSMHDCEGFFHHLPLNAIVSQTLVYIVHPQLQKCQFCIPPGGLMRQRWIHPQSLKRLLLVFAAHDVTDDEAVGTVGRRFRESTMGLGFFRLSPKIG